MDYFSVRRDAFEDAEGWWGPNCIAAYRFKGADSERESWTDLTGNGYNLIKQNSPEWSADKGYRVFNSNWLNNTPLGQRNDVHTIVIRYSGMSSSGSAFIPLSYVRGATDTYEIINGMYVAGRLQLHYQTQGSQGPEFYVDSVYPGVLTSYIGHSFDWVDNHGRLIYYLGNQKLPSSGVFGVSVNDANQAMMYLNGASIGVTKKTIKDVYTIYNVKSPNVQTSSTIMPGAVGQNGDHYVQAAAFYSSVLSADRQAEVYEAMRAL